MDRGKRVVSGGSRVRGRGERETPGTPAVSSLIFGRVGGRETHLGNDDHVAEVGADSLGLLAADDLLLRLAKLLDELHGLAGEAALEAAADARAEEVDERLGLHVEELLEVRPAEGELAEGPLLGGLGHESIFLRRRRRGREKGERG